MGESVDKTIKKMNYAESKILSQNKKDSALKQKIYEQVPDKLVGVLEIAFIKAFETIFLKGTSVIEKTFDKENMMLDFDANNYIFDKKESDTIIKRMDKPAQKSNLFNQTITTSTGLGLGLLGMGLPDIPLLVATVLKGLYQVALSYGFDYTKQEEQIYILRLIGVALLNGAPKRELNELLDSKVLQNTDINYEIKVTAKIMANELLVEKFVQGIPIVGVIGAATNWSTYRKISKLSVIKYKKRYLINRG